VVEEQIVEEKVVEEHIVIQKPQKKRTGKQN